MGLTKHDRIAEAIAEKKGTEHDGTSDANGAEKNVEIDRIGKKLFVIVETPLVDQYAVSHQPEAVRKHQRVGNEQEQRDPK